MSILNKFFKEKEPEQNVQNVQSVQNQIKTKELSLNGENNSRDNSLLNLMQENNLSTTGKFNKDISERLLSAFEKANLPENDFFEFCKALQVSDKNGAEKFSSTFKILQSIDNKLTKEKLIETSKHYTEILEKEKNAALETFSSQKNTLENKIKKLEDDNDIMREDIENNEKQIKNYNEQLKNVLSISLDFDVTYDEVKNKIIDNI